MAPQSQVIVCFLIPLAINSSFMYRLRSYINERLAIDGFMVVFDLMRWEGGGKKNYVLLKLHLLIAHNRRFSLPPYPAKTRGGGNGTVCQ